MIPLWLVAAGLKGAENYSTECLDCLQLGVSPGNARVRSRGWHSSRWSLRQRFTRSPCSGSPREPKPGELCGVRTWGSDRERSAATLLRIPAAAGAAPPRPGDALTPLRSKPDLIPQISKKKGSPGRGRGTWTGLNRSDVIINVQWGIWGKEEGRNIKTISTFILSSFDRWEYLLLCYLWFG